MEETSLDEGPTANFERATLEISNDAQGIETRTNELSDKDKGLNSSNVSGKAQSKKNIPTIPYQHINTETFFSDRHEVVERALKDCHESIKQDGADEIVDSWLLTEISLWDTEKERLVVLTKTALYSIKYDFISLKLLGYSKVLLQQLDTVIFGELVYPVNSLVPRLNGLAEGMSSMLHHAIRRQWSSISANAGFSQQFEPRKRNMTGLRFMWNQGQPITLNKKWNPFARDIPWLTYASHPLFWHKGSDVDKTRFDIEALYTAILGIMTESCPIIKSSIIIENYCGVAALLHNRSNLGFFKIRGKVSF